MIKEQVLFLLILMLTVACNVPTTDLVMEQTPTAKLTVIPWNIIARMAHMPVYPFRRLN